MLKSNCIYCKNADWRVKDDMCGCLCGHIVKRRNDNKCVCVSENTLAERICYDFVRVIPKSRLEKFLGMEEKDLVYFE